MKAGEGGLRRGALSHRRRWALRPQSSGLAGGAPAAGVLSRPGACARSFPSAPREAGSWPLACALGPSFPR